MEGRKLKKSGRLKNLEELRCIAMFMVVILHYLGKGNLLGDVTADTMDAVGIASWILEAFCIVAVNVYMLITGYFLSNSEFRLEKFLKLYLQVWTYSVAVGVFCAVSGITPAAQVDTHFWLSLIFPVSMGHYWFMTAYLFLYAMIPLITRAIKQLTDKQLAGCTGLLLVFFCVAKSILPFRLEMDGQGYDVIWYLCVFLVAACLRRFQDHKGLQKSWQWLLIYGTGVVLILAELFVLRGMYLKTGSFGLILKISFEYNHIFVLLASVGLFEAFLHAKGEGLFARASAAVSPYVLGVYLLHENIGVRYSWQKWFGAQQVQTLEQLLGSLLTAGIVIFVTGVIVEWVRVRILNFLQKTNWLQKAELLLLAILIVYPLRHIFVGIDLWDTGYHYANFEYMGLDHMDSMWLYSTYLANAAGHFMTLLPGGHTLAGMNLYTGLTASILAVAGYLFCTRKLGYKKWIVFLGEMAALSLCWCPTAALYNYLTYIGFLGCVILLYCGLTEDRPRCLAGAGICLGCNILVRFSNLPEAGLILAVWVYGGLRARRKRETFGQGLRRTLADTGWCLGGYLSALLVLAGWIQIRYGITDYMEGILRLFAMTDSASDYKATSMITGMLYPYVENLYWLLRIGVIVVVGVLAYALVRWVLSKESGRFFEKGKGEKAARVIGRTGSLVLAGIMLAWLYERGFCSWEFYSYGAVLRPGIMFLMLTLMIACIRILNPKGNLEDKLISGILILVIFLTSLGSNNGIYPSLNNLFVAAPYTFHWCLQFLKRPSKEDRAFPVKTILAAFLGLFLIQIALFGKTFVFAESTGVQNPVSKVENNEALKNIRMSPDKAENFQGLSDYVTAQSLQGREVISFGKIPAVSFYLQMPPAFNSWCDLKSFQPLFMKNALVEIEGKIAEGVTEKPVLIFERKTGDTFMKMMKNVDNSGICEIEEENDQEMQKLQMLCGFAKKLNYELSYENEGYVVWQ